MWLTGQRSSCAIDSGGAAVSAIFNYLGEGAKNFGHRHNEGKSFFSLTSKGQEAPDHCPNSLTNVISCESIYQATACGHGP